MRRPTATRSCWGTVGTHAQGQSLYKKPLYNAAVDFTPVALIAEVPIVLITRKDLPVASLPEFISYTKANQAHMQFGSGGAGSATHLGCLLLDATIGVNTTHVPYRAAATRRAVRERARTGTWAISAIRPQPIRPTPNGVGVTRPSRLSGLCDNRNLRLVILGGDHRIG